VTCSDLQLCSPYLWAQYRLFRLTVQFGTALKRCTEHNTDIHFFLKCSKSVATSGAAGEPVRVTETLSTRIAASGHVSSLAMGMWGTVDILKCSVLLQGPTDRPTDRLSATVAWSVPKWGYRLSFGVHGGTEDSAACC
jgi:hypothetical protein